MNTIEKKENNLEPIISNIDPIKKKSSFIKRIPKTVWILFFLIFCIATGLYLVRHFYLIPKNRILAREHFQKGLQCKDVSCEIENFSTAIDLDDDFSLAYWARHLSNESISKIQDAERDRYRALRSKEHIYKMKDELENLIEKYPENSKLYLFRGALTFDDLINRDAYWDVDKAIKLDLQNALAYYYRYVVSFANYPRTNEEEINDLNMAIALNPNNSKAYKRRSRRNFNFEKFKEAADDLSKVIQLEKDDISWRDLKDYYLQRAVYYRDSKEFDKALEDIETVLQLKKENNINDISPAILSIRGSVYLGKHNYQKALEDFNKAIELDSDYKDSYLYRGRLYVETGEDEKASEDFDKLIKLANENKDVLIFIYQYLSKMYMELDKQEMSEKYQNLLKEIKEKKKQPN